jgi:PepSY-associated TM region
MAIWLLKLHRWVALVFALPLVFLLGTGLMLSVEPWLVVGAIEPASLTPAKVAALLSQHDPNGQARTLVYSSYDKTLTIGAGRGGGTVVDVASGRALSGPSALTNALVTARRLHETLLMDAGWLVVGSTIAMLALAVLGCRAGTRPWPGASCR